jgi:hypothetical protein
MCRLKISVLLIGCIFLQQESQAQKLESTGKPDYCLDSSYFNWDMHFSHPKNRFPAKQLLLPGAMVAYGFATLGHNELQEFNAEVKDEVYAENPHAAIHVDNYLQFVPAAAVYALNAIGIKGKNNFHDRTMIFLMSNLVTNTTVYSVKKLSHRLRPDGSAYTSFPSGHTAEAFLSAEFLYQEYKDVSPWYGVAGYAVAATTGYLRLYNNKHWLGDVVAGAGIGMASTKICYWLYPKLQHLLFKDKAMHTAIMPTYQDGSYGFSLDHQF